MLALLILALPATASAACTMTIGSPVATPSTVGVGATVAVAIPISYQGCSGTVITVRDNNPARLTYASCAVSDADWNCSSVSTSAGVTSSSFTPGNNGNRSSTLTYTYTAASAGTTTVTLANNISASTGTTGTITIGSTVLANYRFDETSWSGTAGEVLDSSGNAYNATRGGLANTVIGSPAYTSGAQSTCNYGRFDVTGSPNAYVQLPAGFPSMASSFTITAWIRTNNVGKIGQRILVRDDNDNGWALSLSDEVAGTLRLFNRNIAYTGGSVTGGGALRAGNVALDTPVVFSNNIWYFVAGVVDLSSKTVTLYVYNTAGTQLAKTSASFTGAWGAGTGATSIGNETAASGENGLYLSGNIDELRVLRPALAQAEIAGLLSQVRTCPTTGPDHVELAHDGTAVTCTPKAITVYACTGAASCASSPASQYTAASFPVSLTAIAGATWCSDSLCASTLTSPATVSNGQVIYLKDANVRTDTMAGTASTASNTTLQCYNTSTAAFNATTACQVAFAASGFLVSLPNHVSCTSSTLTIQAVKASNNAAVCAPAFTGTRSETISFSYSNPATGTLTPSVGGTPIASGGTSVSLSFDASGIATPSFSYADVGKLSISVTDAALGMSGSTSTLPVIAPASFGLSGITAGPIGAGNAFSATVTARNNCATPTTTPNFGKETSPESVSFSLGSRVAPAGANDCVNGPCNGTVAGSVASWTSGVATASNLSYSEVGQITLAATLASGSYLGSGLSASGVSGTIGDFVPAYFDTTVTQGCGSFTYSGQPFTVGVTARNAAGGATVNYSNLAGCAVCAKAVTLQDPSATANFNGTNVVPAASFARGVASLATVKYSFPGVATAPTLITLRAIDSSVTPNVTSSGHTEGTSSIRSGRLRLANANGSELLALPIPAYVEYYASAAQGWQTNAADTGCTVLAASDFAFSFPVNGANRLAACETAVSVSGSPPAPTISLAKPGAGNDGWADLTLNLGASAAGNRCTAVGGAGPAATTANKPWLQYNWSGSTGNPTSRARFGTPKSGPTIYQRELY